MFYQVMWCSLMLPILLQVVGRALVAAEMEALVDQEGEALGAAA